MKKMIPSVADVTKEGLIVLGGAILAALIIGQLPGLKQWIKAQWGDTPKP
jgi:hypothetical protein